MNIKGFTYGWDAKRGMFKDTEKVGDALSRLKENGCNWLCLPVKITQDKFCSTTFGFDYRFCVTDKEVTMTVKAIHEKGMKVCLKPMVNCKDGTWRAEIGFPDESAFEGKWDAYWKEWFSCYTAFICHYAEIAEDTGCDMLCIGCEMLGTERKEEYWRNLIKEVRKIYSGPITYNTNHGHEDELTWWDAVDYLGTSAYYRVAAGANEPVEKMMEKWQVACDNLKEISKKYNKKIIFMEIGCRSALSCPSMPWDFMHHDLPYDESEQANFYESCFRVFGKEDFLEGIFWWDWGTYLYTLDQAKQQRGFAIYGKQAENVLKDWYNKL